MIKLHRTLLAAALLVAATTSSQAAAITGSLGFAGTDGTIVANPSNNLASPALTLQTSGLTASTNGLGTTGDYGAFKGLSLTFSPTLINVSSLAGLTLNFGGSGAKFVATSGSVAPTPTADLVKIILVGNVSGFAGFDANTASVSLTFQRVTSSDPITFTGQLTSPAVPEPSSVALASIGMAAAGLFSLRKRLAK